MSVSAASSAISVVSRSRISPTRITFGRLTKRGTQREPKFLCPTDFALVYRAFFVIVEKFYRVFDCDDMITFSFVDFVMTAAKVELFPSRSDL
jgi:hypothetical protein